MSVRPAAAVLGYGLDVDYPRDNRDLFEQIVQCCGALISEYSLGAQRGGFRCVHVAY